PQSTPNRPTIPKGNRERGHPRPRFEVPVGSQLEGYSDFCRKETKKEISNVHGTQDLPRSQWREGCRTPLSTTTLFYPTRNLSETRHYNLLDVYDFVGFPWES